MISNSNQKMNMKYDQSVSYKVVDLTGKEWRKNIIEKSKQAVLSIMITGNGIQRSRQLAGSHTISTATPDEFTHMVSLVIEMLFAHEDPMYYKSQIVKLIVITRNGANLKVMDDFLHSKTKNQLQENNIDDVPFRMTQVPAGWWKHSDLDEDKKSMKEILSTLFKYCESAYLHFWDVFRQTLIGSQYFEDRWNSHSYDEEMTEAYIKAIQNLLSHAGHAQVLLASHHAINHILSYNKVGFEEVAPQFILCEMESWLMDIHEYESMIMKN